MNHLVEQWVESVVQSSWCCLALALKDTACQWSLFPLLFSCVHLTEECRWLGIVNDFVELYMSVKLLECSQMLMASFTLECMSFASVL
jgi:hypothetical protein